MMNDLRIITMLAWRNVWRNKRRTILTLLTILVGCAMIILMNAIAKGGHDRMIEDAVSMNTGHIQVHEKGFHDNQTIDYAFIPALKLMQALEGHPAVESYAPRIHAAALLSSGESTAGAMIQGIDPEREILTSLLNTKILPGGRFLNKSDTRAAVLGDRLAKTLNVIPGQTISFISQGFDGSIAADRLTVTGIFSTGNPEYDKLLMLMPLQRADYTFSMMGYIHSIAIKLTTPGAMNGLTETLRGLEGSSDLEVMGWDALMPVLVQFIVMDDVSAYIFDFILLMLVAFGILNTIQMSVFERTREFGIMLSIGTRPSQVRSMVLLESAFISIMGVVLGTLLGYLLSWYFYINPIDYSDYAQEIAVWGISTVMFPADATWLNMTVTAGFTFVFAMLFSIFPARRASKLKPIEAIRQL